MKVELNEEKIEKVKQFIDETKEDRIKTVDVVKSSFTGPKDKITRTQYMVRIPKEFAEEIGIKREDKFQFKIIIENGKKKLIGELLHG